MNAYALVWTNDTGANTDSPNEVILGSIYSTLKGAKAGALAALTEDWNDLHEPEDGQPDPMPEVSWRVVKDNNGHEEWECCCSYLTDTDQTLTIKMRPLNPVD